MTFLLEEKAAAMPEADLFLASFLLHGFRGLVRKFRAQTNKRRDKHPCCVFWE
jgi:hypothetical protein